MHSAFQGLKSALKSNLKNQVGLSILFYCNQKLVPFIVPVIRHLCNLSLQSGTFPQCLKEAMVYPCIKKPNMDPEQLKSYRQISNLSYISKIVERVVAKSFTAHVNASNLLPVHQSAYRAHHSTETAILSVCPQCFGPLY